MTKQAKPIRLYSDDLQKEMDDRENVWVYANPAFKKKLEWCQKWYITNTKNHLLASYELGLQVKEVREDDEHGGHTFSYNALQRLRKYFQWDVKMDDALRLALAYSREEIERFAKEQMPNGQPISVTHLLNAAEAGDAEKQNALLEQAIDEGWTASRIENVLKVEERKNHPSRVETRGRKIAIPESVAGLATQLQHYADDFLTRAQKVWDNPDVSLTAQWEEIDPSEITESLHHGLEAYVASMQKMADKAKKLAGDGRTVCEACRKALDARIKPLSVGKAIIPVQAAKQQMSDDESPTTPEIILSQDRDNGIPRITSVHKR